MRNYPPAPWHLCGWAIQTLHALPIAVARRYVPCELPIVPIWPGRTLATVVVASYESGSLVYRELLLGIGLVWLRGPRFCIPRLWVDSEASILGGREIWKLPKEFASFDVRRSGESLQIEASGICRIEAQANRFSLPLWLPVLAFGRNSGGLFPFMAHMHARASVARAWITTLGDEFAAMELRRPLLSFYYDSLDVIVHAPRQVITPNVRAATCARSTGPTVAVCPRESDRTK